jgi:hypothetical protein
LTDLGSDIFTVSPKLIQLNVSFNNLSILNSTVIPQLAKLNSSVDLNSNLSVCDCCMFNTIYSWCRNNSVDLELVCSSAPKFKGQSWTIFENLGSDGDFADQVGNIAKVNYTLSPERVAKYLGQSVPYFSPVREHVPPLRTNVCYFYICIVFW